MVIGNGLIANCFREYTEIDSVLIFASGVSNSQQVDPIAFKREHDLVAKFKDKKSLFIYFSTCSIQDPSLSGSAYIQHKLKVEKYIIENFEKYWIVRLPNVVGRSNNPTTLANYLFNAISQGKEFVIFKKAYRYFIDVADVQSAITNMISSARLGSGIYNLLYPLRVPVSDLVALFERKIGKQAKYVINEINGSFYDVEMSKELESFAGFGIETSIGYIEQMIDRYYKFKDDKLYG